MTVTVDPETRRDELAGRVFSALVGALEIQAMYLGERLGLYRVLADGGPATAPELAARADIDPRYAREWLEQQAVSSVLDVDAVDAQPDARRYSLPAGHEAVVVDFTSTSFMAPLPRFAMGIAQQMPAVLDAFRTGAGIDWADYGPDVIEAQAAANRPQFLAYVRDWIDGLPDIAARLREGNGHVADVACGTGWSSIAIARAFPGVHVDGIDVDHGSIERARATAADEGMGGQVAFLHADGANADGAARYDLVTIFEALHDMSRPVEVLVAARRLLAPGGAVLIADERTAEQFTVPGDDMERLFYAFSVLACLPNGLYDQPSVGTGTVIRPAAVEAFAREAGFAGVAILPIEHEQFRLYRLDP
jgi:2-polyprenyl-3-methyl-5-hydroxy-6-metoxy-1,4-benzoquinol methylase